MEKRTNLTILYVLVALVMVAGASAVLEDSDFSYVWTLNESSNLTASTGGYDLTRVGNAWHQNTDCANDWCYDVDGNGDYLRTSNPMVSRADRTWIIWAQSDITGAAYVDSAGLFNDYNDGTNTGFMLRVNSATNSIEGGVGDSDGGTFVGHTSTLDTSMHMYGLVFDSGDLRLYVDCLSVDNETGALYGSSPNNVFLGTYASATTREWDGTFDEGYTLNQSVTGAEMCDLYAAGVGDFYPLGAPVFTITAQNNYTQASISTFNATLTNTTVSWDFTTSDGTLDSNVSGGLFNISVEAYSYENHTLTNWNVSTNLVANLTPFGAGNQTYSDPVIELSSTTISLRVNESPSVTNSTAFLTWNGTVQNVTKTQFTGYSIYESTFNVTEQDSTPINVSFQWEFNVTAFGTNWSYSLAETNQTIEQIGIDNCSTYTVRAYNISILDEVTEAALNGTIEGYFEAWVVSDSSFRAFNLTWGGDSEYGLCIDPDYGNFTVSAQLVYTSDGYTSKTYYWTNTTLDNSTDLLDLYLTPNSTTIEYEVTDQDDNEVAGVYIYVQSYDIGTNSYLTSEIVRTGDDGRVVGEIILGNPYRFILYYNDELVLETQEIYLTEVTKKFRIDLTDDYFDNYDQVLGVSCDISYTNSTRTFRYVWADGSGAVTQACLTVTRETINGITQVNQTCASSASGTALASITADPTGAFSYVGSGVVTINGLDYVCGDPASWSDDTTYLVYGAEGRFASILIVITLVMFGAWNPIVSVFLAIIAIIFTVLLNLFHLSYAALLAAIIVGGIAIYRLKQG